MDTPPERTSHRIRAARVGRRPAGFRAIIMAAAVVFVLAYVFFLRTPPPLPVPKIQSLQGTYVFESQYQGARRSETGAFSAMAGGDAMGRMQITRAGSSQSRGVVRPSVYDAGRRTELTLTSAWPRGLSYSRTVGAWPPVWRVAARSPLDYQGLAAIVRSAVEDGDHTVGIKPLKDGDRTVWRATMDFGDSAVEVVVDQQTGIVLWYSWSGSGGQSTFTATVDWTAPPPAANGYAIDLPKDARLATERDGDYHYRPTLAAAAASVGFTPLESTLEPDGYTLRAVAVGRHGTAAELFGGEDHSPPGMVPRPTQDNEVAMLYTRGLTWFSIKMVAARSTPRFAAISREVVTQYAAHGLSPDSEVLQYGAFAGATAHTWYAEDGPTLFVANAEYAVVVRGALTRQELLSLAEGLQPLGSG
ncbi:MAG TPA: hypothetical protein VIL79_05700 [Thermoleophilia bacterium]